MDYFNMIIKRQQGVYVKPDFDYALSRLTCYKTDVYRGFTQTSEDELYCGNDTPIFASKFCPKKGYEHAIALANEDGYIALQKTNKQKEFLSKQGHFNAIFDIAWMPNDLYLVTAAGDHTAALWNVNGPDIVEVSKFEYHTRSLKTVVFRHEDKAVFATGARDGAIMIWDIRANHSDQPRPDNCIMKAHGVSSFSKRTRKNYTTSRIQSITGLAFQDDYTLLSCAAGDGIIKVWDLRKNYTVHKKDPIAKHSLKHVAPSTRNGFTTLLMCPSQVTLYASCMNNVIYAYNIGTYNPQPVFEYYGHENNTYYVKSCLSPDGKYIASGSSGEAAYIWKTSQPGTPIVRLSGHRAEVSAVAWSHEHETKIITCSDDATHRIWKIGVEHDDSEDDENEVRGHATWINKKLYKNPKDLSEKQLQTSPTTDFSMSADDLTPNSGASSDNNVGCSNVRNSAKRTYDQMNNHVLSPIYENREYKRAHIERGIRRLFSPTGKDEPTCSKYYEFDELSFRSPTKSNNQTSTIFSPTLNLPNFVLDGTAPHLLEMSPQKMTDNENVDWLTKMRKERLEQKSAEKAKNAKCQGTPPGRKRAKSIEPRRPTTNTSLLKYFKIQTKEDNKNVNVPQPSTSKDLLEEL